MGAEQQSNLGAGQKFLHAAIRGGAEGEAVADDLMAVHDVLVANRALVRALTDVGRSASAREHLASQVFASHVDELSAQLLELMVGLHWTKSADLPLTIRELGLDAAVLAEDFEKKPDVSQQLVEACALIMSNQELRLQLSDLGRGTPAERAALADRIFAGHVSPITQKLIRRAARDVEYGHLVEFLSDTARRAAELNGQLLVICTSARPLSDEQAQRMTRLSELTWGRRVDLAQLVDPSLIGGFRLVAGDEAIDTTIRNDIALARTALAR